MAKRKQTADEPAGKSVGRRVIDRSPPKATFVQP